MVILLALMKVFLVKTWLFFLLLISSIILFTACFFLHYFMHSDYDSTGSNLEDGRHQLAQFILLFGYKKQTV